LEVEAAEPMGRQRRRSWPTRPIKPNLTTPKLSIDDGNSINCRVIRRQLKLFFLFLSLLSCISLGVIQSSSYFTFPFGPGFCGNLLGFFYRFEGGPPLGSASPCFHHAAASSLLSPVDSAPGAPLLFSSSSSSSPSSSSSSSSSSALPLFAAFLAP